MKRTLPVFLFALLTLALIATPALADAVGDGKKALDAQAWEKAAGHFQKALEKKANDAEAAVGLARAAIGGELTDLYFMAEEALYKVIEGRPNRRDARLALGDLYIASAKSKVTDPKSMEFTFKDAMATFKKLLKEDGKDEAAAVGLARSMFNLAMFDDAVGALDQFMAKNESKGPALYWKGKLLYTQALDAYRAAGKIDEGVKELFRKAQGSYLAATQVNPEHFDAWIQLGYATQYLGGDAQEAYEKAMDLDPQSMAPLKGIEALYYYRAKEYPAALEKLIEAHPDNIPVHFYVGFQALAAKQYDKAIESLGRFEKKADEPGMVWTHLAKAYAGKGDDDQAAKLFDKALGFNPDDLVAAEGIDQQLRKKHFPTVGSSPKHALEMAAAYEKLFRRAPNNVWVRNNIAFILREVITRHPGEAKWRPVLDACVRIYEGASELAEQQLRGREATTPFSTRFGYAGVISDTGLMYQFYPSIKDYEKAEDYYIRALELTQDGYKDAFANLGKIYEEQEKWDALHELATSCGQNLKMLNGQPESTARAYARGVAARLEQEGKVKVGGD